MIDINNENFHYFSPVVVFVVENETEEQFDERWRKFDSLSEVFKDKLSDDKIPEIIREIANSNNLRLSQVALISRMIRDYFFGEIRTTDFPEFLINNAGISENVSREITSQIIKKILNSDFQISDKLIKRKTVEFSISQAMQTYPHVGEQSITSGMIKLKIFPQPVRPSIKNWVEDYRSVMGAEKHGMMERGNYLFHTENTKRLTSGERKKLAEILRSLDEDVALKVDPDRQEIVFEQAEEMKPVEKLTNYQNSSLSRSNAGGSLDRKENVQNIPRSNFQAPKQQIPNYPQSNPLLKDDGMRMSQNIPNQNFQSSNKVPSANVRFSSPQTFSSEKRSEPAMVPFQQLSNYPSRNSGVSAISQSNRKTGYANPRAGKPWEPASTQRSEPKVSGNTVDLRN